MQITSPLWVELVGYGSRSIDPNSFVASGGEASVYRVDDLAVKLWNSQRPEMVTKIRQLAQLQHASIVAPRGLVLDRQKRPIGLYMPFIVGNQLPIVCSNGFRKRTGFDDSDAHHLVDGMFQTMEYAHGQKAVMIDPNERNWTVTQKAGKYRLPFVVDVDSWWPKGVTMPSSVAIMPSIRDWVSGTIGPEADRFALAVVSFQVYSGIHPFKGILSGYTAQDLTRRMQDKKSVFAPGVRIPQSVRDFNSIPGPLLAWYRSVFQEGVRTAPPSPLTTGKGLPSMHVLVSRVVVTGGNNLKYQKLLDQIGDPAVAVFYCGVVRLASGKLYDLESKRFIGQAENMSCRVVRVEGGWLQADLVAGEPMVRFIDDRARQQRLTLNLAMTEFVTYENRLFAVTDTGLTELEYLNLGRPLLTPGNTWGALPNATRWFDGLGVQDAMGAASLIVPFGDGACAHVRVPELDGLRALSGKAGDRFVAIVALDRSGQYHKLQFTFDRDYRSYQLWRGLTDEPELNMAILPRGVAATIVRDGQLVIFVPTQGGINRLSDKDITTAVVLANWHNQVLGIRNGQVWGISMS